MKELSISVFSPDSVFLQAFVENLTQYFPLHPIYTVDKLVKLLSSASTIGDQPKLIFVDLSSPNLLSKFHLFKLYQSFPNAEILVILKEEKHSQIFEFIQAGASGYLLKGNWKEVLPVLLNSITDQNTLISPKMARYLIDRVKLMKDMVAN